MYQYSYGFATGVNDFGTVVGTQKDTYYDYSDPEYVVSYEVSRSFVWANGVMQELAMSNATAINNAGKIVGNGPFDYAGVSDPRQHAFLLTPVAKTWIGPTSGGDWSTAANWSPSGVPTAGDIVTISGQSVTSRPRRPSAG